MIRQTPPRRELDDDFPVADSSKEDTKDGEVAIANAVLAL